MEIWLKVGIELSSVKELDFSKNSYRVAIDKRENWLDLIKI